MITIIYLNIQTTNISADHSKTKRLYHEVMPPKDADADGIATSEYPDQITPCIVCPDLFITKFNIIIVI